MITDREVRDMVAKARLTALEAKERHNDLLNLGKSVSIEIDGTVYGRPYWEGTVEEFREHILKKYYDK